MEMDRVADSVDSMMDLEMAPPEMAQSGTPATGSHPAA